MLCKYRHVFGKEGEGVHSVRFMNIAVIDVLGTVLGGALIAWLAGWGWRGFLLVTVLLFVIAILMHRLFCVNTTVNKAIFGVV